MTIRVGPERSTLTLPFNRLRSEDARGAAPASDAPGQTKPASVRETKPADAAQLRAGGALLDRASSIADAALGAANTITELLEQLRAAATAARELGAQPDDTFRNLGERVSQAVKGALFDGVNLLDGSQSNALRVPVSGEGDELSLSSFDFSPGRDVISVTAGDEPAASVEAVDASISKVQDARRQLQEDAKRVDAHRSFVRLLQDALGGSSENLGVDGAKLAALQLRQSLGEQSFSIANQAPQAVLSLFR